MKSSGSKMRETAIPLRESVIKMHDFDGSQFIPTCCWQQINQWLILLLIQSFNYVLNSPYFVGKHYGLLGTSQLQIQFTYLIRTSMIECSYT
jgi:hypothetical protein